MFKSKETVEDTSVKNRGYLEILPGFVSAVKKDFKLFTEESLAKIFIDINKGKYDLLNITKAHDNHAALVSVFEGLGLTPRIKRVIDNAIGTTIANEEELEILLTGITNSLTLTSSDRKRIEDSFRKFPVLIYGRIIELTVVT